MVFPSSPPESLEPRIAPAGIVAITFENGVLKLTGDATSNQIDVVGTATGVSISDPGMGDTHFSFEGELLDHVDLIGPIRRIAIDLPDGPGKVVHVASLNVAENIRVSSVADHSVVTFDTVAAGGTVKISAVASAGPNGGVVSIEGGPTTAKKGLFVTAEDFSVSSQSLTAAELSVSSYSFAEIAPRETLQVGARGLSLLPAHDSMAEISSNVVSVRGSITLETGGFAGGERALTLIGFTRASIGGSVVVHRSNEAGQADAVRVTLGLDGGRTAIAGDLNFTGTAGADTLELAGAVSVGGDLTGSFDAGNDVLRSDDLERLRVAGNVRLSNSGGSDALDLGATGALAIGGDLEIDSRANDVMLVFASNVDVGGALSVRVDGQGSDGTAAVSLGAFGRFSVSGEAAISNLGSGDTTIDITAGRLLLPGGLSYLGRTGANVLTVDAGSVGRIGEVRIEPGNGASEVSITALAGGFIGPVNYIGGIGDDTFTYQAAVKSTGPFLIDFNGGNSSTLFAPPTEGLRLALAQRLIIRGADIDEGVDSVELRGIDAGRVVLDLGPGDDALIVNDSTFAGIVSAALGAGADSASIEVGSGPTPSIFRGPLLVDLGSGDDALHLGEAQPGSLIVLNSVGTFDGGPDTDTRTGPTSAVKAKSGAPIFTGFE